MLTCVNIQGVDLCMIVEPSRQHSSIEEIEREEELLEIYKALEKLNDRNRELLALRFGLYGLEAHTLQEIADYTGFKRQTIHQSEKRALKALRKILVCE